MKAPTIDPALARFVGRLRDRLKDGDREHGDIAFTKPPAEFIERDLGDVADSGQIVLRQPSAPTSWDRRTRRGETDDRD